MKWILTVLDEYSRYLEAFVVEHPDSETVINVLSNQVFARYGLPNKVHSDRGKAFMSTDIQQFLDGCGIEISHSSKYKPAGNGQNLVFLQRRRKRQCPHCRLTAPDPDL